MANNFLEKVLVELEKVGMRIPKNLEKVQEKFESIFTDMLQVEGNLSYIQKVRKLLSLTKEQDSLRKMFEQCWIKFTQDYFIKLTILSTDELQEIQGFLSDVVQNPSSYETKYVNELFELYEKLFNANQGFSNIVNPDIFRKLIINLAISRSLLKFKSKYVDKVDKLNWLFGELNMHFTRKYQAKLQLSKIILKEDCIWNSINQEFLLPMLKQNQGNLVFGSFAIRLIQIIIEDNTITFNWKIDIFKEFIELWKKDDSLFHETFSYNERDLANLKVRQQHFMRSYQEKQDLRWLLQILAREPQRQNVNYREILQKYLEYDMYSEQYESFIVKQCEDIYQRKQRREVTNPLNEQISLFSKYFMSSQQGIQSEEFNQIINKYKDKISKIEMNQSTKVVRFHAHDPQKYIDWFFSDDRYIFNNKIIALNERLSQKDAFSRFI